MRKAYTLYTHLGEDDVTVDLLVGEREPVNGPLAGSREVEILSVMTDEGRDLTDHAESLDIGALLDEVSDIERDELAWAEMREEDLHER